MRLTLALAQFDVRIGQPAQNLSRVKMLVAEAAGSGCDLVLLPELWSSGYDLPGWQNYAVELGQGQFGEMAALACQSHLWLGGSLLEKSAGQVYNTFVLYNPQGELAAYYRKIHLFRLMDEHIWLAGGDRPVVVDLPWGRTCLTVCYDLRFPELYRQAALDGAVLYLICAQWPERRITHWDTLLRARAIENQACLAAVNRVGHDQADTFGGHSALIGPWGETLASTDSTETLLIGELDFVEVQNARRRIPVFEDRRPEAYLSAG